MRLNGKIQFLPPSSNTLNEYSEVVVNNYCQDFSDDFNCDFNAGISITEYDCFITRIKDNKQATYSNGESFRQSSWKILIEGLFRLIDVYRVRITLNNNDLGVFNVMYTEILYTMNRTIIIV